MNECGKIWQNLTYMQVTETNTQNKEWMNECGKIWQNLAYMQVTKTNTQNKE